MAKNNVTVTVSQEGDVAVLAVDGPVDSVTIDSFKEQLDPICGHSGARVLLDCGGLTYLNSRAIGLLMRYHKTLFISRGKLALCNLNQRLVRTIEILQLGKSLLIFPTRNEAMAAIRA
jgi:anti-anti-sigma factor